MGGSNWNLVNFLDIILSDVHPPLYNLLLLIYSKFIGSSDFCLRFFSTIWIIICGYISYILIHKYINSDIAFIFICIFMLNPNTIYYSQELRNYAMLLGLSSIFIILCYLLYEKINNNNIQINKNTIIITITTIGIALILTHYYAYIFVFSVGIVLLALSIHKKILYKEIFITFFIIGLAGIVWLIIHLNYGALSYRMSNSYNGNEWIYEKSLLHLLFSIILSSLGKFGWAMVIVSSIYVLIKDRQKSIKQIIDYLPFIFMIIIELMIISIVFIYFSKTITQRYFIMLYPIIYLFIAILFSNKKLKYFLLILITSIYLHSIYISSAYIKNDIRGASIFIKQNFDSNYCKLPINWISYARYLQDYKIIYKPIIQDNCDLIFFNIDNSNNFTHTKIILKNNDIQNYILNNFNGAVVVTKKIESK